MVPRRSRIRGSSLAPRALPGILLALGWLALPEARAEDAPLVFPSIRGDWWVVAGNPDLGKYTSPEQQPVDFAIWQAADGTWQLWSCVRGTRCGGNTRLFFRWEGKRITDPDWEPKGIAMEADPSLGETPGGLQAPHVIRVGDRFEMFYGDWEHIRRARSADGKSFSRWLEGESKGALFSEGRGANTRDVMVVPVGELYHAYYTAIVDIGGLKGRGAVYCRKSRDLARWSPSVRVAYGGGAGTGPYSAECPHLVWRPESKRWYLFRTQSYAPSPQTSVYASKDPLDFGIEDDRCRLGTLPVAAPELVRDGDEEYIAALLPSLKGIRIARLEWPRRGP